MCLVCGCNQPTNSHGGGQTILPDGTTATMTTAVMGTPNETPKESVKKGGASYSGRATFFNLKGQKWEDY